MNRVGRRLLLLGAIASCFALAASAKTFQLPEKGWVLSDLNGDRAADMAAAGPGRLDGPGYSREVSISIAGAAKTHFTVHSSSASIRLSVRDIDGDHDRDLVILEPWSSRPIGIWLNDGHGHFEEGNVSEYSGALGERSSRSFGSRASKTESCVVLHEQRSPPVTPVGSAQMLSPPSSFVSRAGVTRLDSFDRSDSHPRAPPCLA